MRKSNYDKWPATHLEGWIAEGWDAIIDTLKKETEGHRTLVIDLYPGVFEDDVLEVFSKAFPEKVIDVRSWMKPEAEVEAMTARFMTDDVLFGYVTNLELQDYFRDEVLDKPRCELADSKVLVGSGAALFAPDDAVIVYADMARWEIQQRFRRHEVKALGIDNRNDAVSVQYKRGYFNDWRICDRHKDHLMPRIDFWLDTNSHQSPKMIDRATFRRGMEQTVQGPFRVVPFFDPAPWGGKWMRETCDLDRDVPNYGWCFDCVPEENSLLLEVNGVRFELPSVDLVLSETRRLLGEAVEARFGKDFPIRFDFLDTMGGGNLSLQVHPTTQFIREQFGMAYTQDESYYLLDAGKDAVVYLGLKEGINPTAMIEDLRAAQRGEISFPAEKYVNKFPAKKHDHYLIPAGTIHCSGHDSMVLEISSTPSIFTFKLWDWNRLGLDGKPRPINVERGKHVIQWERTTEWVNRHIRNHFTVLSQEDGILEERTGLHPNEFIETRRHTFSKTVQHHTNGGVNVLNLVDGEAALIESPEGKFAPFEVHYAETFIIPACVGQYAITPIDGKECMTIKAFVRYYS
ncbi:MAG: class I mannose-6-phosphate isomerase [Bacteroidaceae bacterium]|nr:class I mannose-6-phosphate isomerase [Bacteroidaceae bacterium]